MYIPQLKNTLLLYFKFFNLYNFLQIFLKMSTNFIGHTTNRSILLIIYTAIYKIKCLQEKIYLIDVQIHQKKNFIAKKC